MGRIGALDLGDRWTGIAISDPLGLVARPLITVETKDLERDLAALFQEHKIIKMVVGDPQTMRGTASDQTRSARAHFESLKAQFPKIEWILWDERLSSKQAAAGVRVSSKDDKRALHARAAAVILSSYLEFLAAHSQ